MGAPPQFGSKPRAEVFGGVQRGAMLPHAAVRASWLVVVRWPTVASAQNFSMDTALDDPEVCDKLRIA